MTLAMVRVKGTAKKIPMTASPQLSIVIPVYNEESIVEQAASELTAGLQQRGWSYEIIFAENGSKDQIGRASCRERVCLYV